MLKILRVDVLPWLGIKWLSTYITIRPGELMQIRGHEDIRSIYQKTNSLKENDKKVWKIGF